MIELHTYIYMLLAVATLGMIYIFLVIKQQLSLFRKHVADKNVRDFRRILFLISLVIVLMGLIPISINILSLITETNRPRVVSNLSLVYSLSVHIQSLLLSYLLHRIYRVAAKEDDIREK